MALAEAEKRREAELNALRARYELGEDDKTLGQHSSGTAVLPERKSETPQVFEPRSSVASSINSNSISTLGFHSR